MDRLRFRVRLTDAHPNPNLNPNPNPNRLRFRVRLEQMLSSFIDGMCGKEPIPQSAARHAHIAAPPRLPRGGAGPALARRRRPAAHGLWWRQPAT